MKCCCRRQVKFHAELHGHLKPKEERKRGKKRTALDEEVADLSTLEAENAAIAAAREDTEKNKEAYLSFMKEICGGDGQGK